MHAKRGRISAFRIFAYSMTTLWAIVTLYPFFITLINSVKVNNEIFGKMFQLPSEWHFEYYAQAFIDARMGRYILNSLTLALMTTVVTAVASSMAAYVLARTVFRFTKIIYLLFIVGVMLPIHATIIPVAKIVSGLGGIDNYFVLTLVYVTFQLPQAIFLLTGYMKGINKEIDEAATIDGCSLPGILFKIILPISMPMIATASILVFIFTYSELIFSVILLSKVDLYTVSRGLMYFTGDYTVRMGPIFASIIMAVLPMVLIYVVFHEKVQRGMLAGAVKG
jgi:raffinose/stachyose/melibiose transport system permease protein